MTHVSKAWFKESTEKRKPRFLKETIENRKCRPTQSRIKQNNGHTGIVRKIQFRSSFKNKIVYLKLDFSWITKAQNLKLLLIKCSINFSISDATFLTRKKIKHSWNLFPPLSRGGDWFFKIFEKRKGSDFSHKNGGVSKIGGTVLKRGGYHLFSRRGGEGENQKFCWEVIFYQVVRKWFWRFKAFSKLKRAFCKY